MAPGKKKPRVLRETSSPASTPKDNGSSLEQHRQMLLVLLERKYRSLMRCAQELNLRLSDPSEPRVEIETHLAANGIERQLLLAKIDAIELGSDFRFPSEAEIAALRAAMSALETLIAQAAATQAIIVAGNTVIQTIKANSV